MKRQPLPPQVARAAWHWPRKGRQVQNQPCQNRMCLREAAELHRSFLNLEDTLITFCGISCRTDAEAMGLIQLWADFVSAKARSQLGSKVLPGNWLLGCSKKHQPWCWPTMCGIVMPGRHCTITFVGLWLSDGGRWSFAVLVTGKVKPDLISVCGQRWGHCKWNQG